MSDIPEGYELVQRTQGPTFAGLAGPFYAKRQGRELSLGLRLVGAGDRAQATQHFETVLELDPLHELASRELAAIRRAFTESRKGVLNKLLGRKT